MDLLTLIRITLRRWIIVVPVLLITLAASAYLLVNRGNDYTMNGSYLLVSEEVLNPGAAQLDPAAAADALGGLLEQPSVHQQLRAQNLSTDYTVNVSETSPSVRIVLTAPTAELATASASELIAMAPSLLAGYFGDDSARTIDTRAGTAAEASNVVEQDDGSFTITTAIAIVEVSVNPSNPFSPSQATVRSLVGVAESVGFEDRIGDLAPGTAFTVSSGDALTAIINVQVAAQSSDAAVRAFASVRDQVQIELDRLQDSTNVDLAFRTVFRAIFEDTQPAVNPVSAVRPLAGTLVLGCGVAVSLAALVESLAAGGGFRRLAESLPRKRSRSGGDVDGTDPEPATAEAAEESTGGHVPVDTRRYGSVTEPDVEDNGNRRPRPRVNA